MRLLLYIMLILPFAGFTQVNMQEGFDMLDKGEFEAAVPFFEKVSNDHPENKTAHICLGRAKGLSGHVVEAISIFKQLDQTYNNDFEVSLNLAEAYLWNKEALKAKRIYHSLLESDPDNFAANFGLANANANLGFPEQALSYIENAISIQPNNEQAQISRKYILLDLSSAFRKAHSFEASNEVLEQILEWDPNDKEALINKGINYIHLRKYNKAKLCFEKLFNEGIELFESSILLSHTSMLMHKNKAAVIYANQAVAAAPLDQKELFLRAQIQKVNALGASKKFKVAHKLLDMLSQDIGESPTIELARARLHTWNRQFSKGLAIYNEIEELPYEVHMGKAEIYGAYNEKKNTLTELDAALAINAQSIDAFNLKQKALRNSKPSIELEGNHSNDVGLNEAEELKIRVNIPTKGKHQFYLKSKWRDAKNRLAINKANQLSLIVGDQWQVARNLDFEFAYGALSYNDEENSRSFSYVSDVKLNYRLDNKQTIGLSYDREALNYSSDLIQSGIVSNNYNAFYQFQYHKLPGVYVKYNMSQQSDDNTRNSIFASLFYEINAFPLFKVGVNYTTLSFEEDRSELYFSPDLYTVYEGFVHLGNNYNEKAKITYSALVTAGKQKIEDNQDENIRRIELDLGYRFSPGFHLIASYFNNTAANSTSLGYSFSRYGLKLRMRL